MPSGIYKKRNIVTESRNIVAELKRLGITFDKSASLYDLKMLHKQAIEASIPIVETSAPIKIRVKSLGRIYNSEGATFEEAIDKIKISGGARATSVINVKIGDKEIEKILNGRHTNGLFGQGSPTMKAIHLKGVRAILGV